MAPASLKNGFVRFNMASTPAAYNNQFVTTENCSSGNELIFGPLLDNGAP